VIDFLRGWTAKAPKVIFDNVVTATHAQGKIKGQSSSLENARKIL
jgi:hypothetical protein